MKNPPLPSLLDGLGNSVGYSLVLVIVGGVRELLGAGTLLDIPILPLVQDGGWYVQNGLAVLAPAAFFIIGLLIWGLRTWKPEQVEDDATVVIDEPEELAEAPGE